MSSSDAHGSKERKSSSRRTDEKREPRESRGEPPREERKERREPSRPTGEGQRSARENGEKDPRRKESTEGKERREKPRAPPREPEADQEAWLDSLIADCDDKSNLAPRDAPPRGASGAQAAPPRDSRDKTPKRPSSRADSRPKADQQPQAPAARPEAPSGPAPERKSRQPSDGKERDGKDRPEKRREAAPAAAAPVEAPAAERPAQKPVRPPRQPQKEDIPLSEAVDDEIEDQENQQPAAAYNGHKAAPVSHKLADPPQVSHIEEDIEVNVTVIEHEKTKDDIDEDIEYDDDFEEAAADDEEDEGYQPQVRSSPSPSPSPPTDSSQNNFVSFRPSSASMRAPSPPVVATAAADIKKAMQSEKEKLEKRSSGAAATSADSSARKKGFPPEYESTMPKFNLATSSSPSQKVALKRLQDLKRLKIWDKRTVEKITLFQQRPVSDLSLFLAGKSLKYCNVKTTSCQTGDDDIEMGTGTDEIWNDDKEMQFPTLFQGKMSSGEQTQQLLPFLRRVLPLFDATLRELQSIQGFGAVSQEQGPSQARCSLPTAFVAGYIGAPLCVSDVTICPQWYGADHALALYTWPQALKAPASVGSALDSFMRPMRSIAGLHPMLTGASSSTRPARCLYSFCRLSSLTVVNGRPHLIVAGSEMGSLLVYDLRAKARSPTELMGSPSCGEGVQEALNPDPDIAHFEGPVWVPSAFSTDIFAISSSSNTKSGRDTDFGSEDMQLLGGDLGGGLHNVEICCVRCSDTANGDSLIFAMDAMGVVSFWRVLELWAGIKLALQGSLSLAQDVHCLGGFLSASYLCVHPQQQAQFVAISTSGVRQANRQRSTTSTADGPNSLELLRHPDEDEDGLSFVGAFTTQPCSAAFNPFFPGLLLVAYAEGDLAIFDCSICVPVTHWSSAVAKAPRGCISVAWSTRRPCVFFVKCGDSLDVWDLSDKSHAPVQTLDISAASGAAGSPPPPPPPPSAAMASIMPCSELYVGSDGSPVVSHGGTVFVLGLPSSLTMPLQVIPKQHGMEDIPMDELLLVGHEKAQVFPTLLKHCRTVQVPQLCMLERDLLRRILAGIHPMQAWV